MTAPGLKRLALLGSAAALTMAASTLAAAPAFADPFFTYPTTQSDVVISKTWSAGPVGDGGAAVATISAFNPGASTAHVIIQDTYDRGLTPGPFPPGVWCGTTSYSGYPMFYCHLFVGAGNTDTVDIPFTVNYAGPKVYTKNYKSGERVTLQKAETNWNNFAGQQTTHSVSCPVGYVMVDHSLRKQTVDQGSGTVDDVRLVTSNLTASEWQVTLKNNTTGQAQGKLWAACLKQETNQAGTFAVSGVQTHSVNDFHPVGDAESQFIASCAPGEIPIAVNLRAVPANANYAPYQDQLLTQVGLYANGGPSTVLSAIIHQPADTTLQWRCLSTTSSTGHRMDLSLVTKSVSVPAGQEMEVEASCADDEKGIVGGWSGGKLNGQEPRPKIRTYWFRNTTLAPVTYDVKLLCVGNRLVKGGKIKTSATDPRCNYLGGVHEVSPGNEKWLNDDEACILVRQGP